MDINKVLHLFPIDYPFETLVNRVTSNPPKLDLSPEFQRKYKWDKDGNERASRFIESCLMRIPIPACYFAEKDDSSHLVIDGVQRISTIQKFFNDEFALEGLTVFQELEGKVFSELGNYRSELEATTMRCIVLRKENPKHLIQEIFARLNQGAVQLSNQEIRHAIYPGNFDELLTELAQSDIISNFGLGKLGTKLKDSREDEEMVLRFLAMQSDLSDFQDNIGQYLDKYMAANQVLSEAEIVEKREFFHDTLEKCLVVFDEKVFIGTNKDKPKQSLLYYDLIMWGFTKYDLGYLVENKVKVIRAFSELCSDVEFIKTISGGLGKRNSIIKRRTIWTNYLDQYLNG